MFRRGANRSSLDALSKVFSRFSANATSTSSFKTNASSSSPLVKMMLMQQQYKRRISSWLMASSSSSSSFSKSNNIYKQEHSSHYYSTKAKRTWTKRRRKNCLRRLARRPLIKYENQRKEKRQARLENRSLRTLSSKDSQWSNLYQKSGSKSTRTGPDDTTNSFRKFYRTN